jgi:hypothetical protein
VSSSFYEDEDKMKKKSSLKEMLRHKKTTGMGYKSINESSTKTPMVKKSIKDYDFSSSK